MESVISLIMSVLTGLYSGLVVARWSEFRSLREDAMREVFSALTGTEKADRLAIVSAAMRRLGHLQSAEKLSDIANKYRKLMQNAGPELFPSVDKAMEIIAEESDLKSEIKCLRPSWLSLVLPFYR